MRFMLLGASALMLGACANNEAAREAFVCPVEILKDISNIPVYFEFRTVSFFDGDPTEMVELAPEDNSQNGALDLFWRFERAQDRPIIAVCRYHETEQTETKEVPASITECRLNGEISETGEITGSPQMTCR